MAQGKSVNSSPPSSAPKPGSQLDNMLGSLQSDLNKLGVATVAKGVCGACKKPIAGQVSIFFCCSKKGPFCESLGGDYNMICTGCHSYGKNLAS